MAKRPIFIPLEKGPDLVREVEAEFNWNPGFAPIQKKKNIEALHGAAKKLGYSRLLEISTKSESKIGQRLSAFSLKVDSPHGEISLESAFQGRKAFEKGGPYTDIYKLDSRSAKKDTRIRLSGKIIGFNFFGDEWPVVPKTAFYDCLYIKNLYPHREFLRENLDFEGFTDIEFNPNKSISCQARSCALFVSLLKRNLLDEVLKSQSSFIEIVEGDSMRKKHSLDLRQGKLFKDDI